MLNHFKIAALMIFTLTVLTGFIYPLIVTFFSQILFPFQANGSFILYKDKMIGSKLIGQNFTDDKYFHSRPSEVNYNADKSGGSNLGPTNKKLIEKIKLNHERLQRTNPSSLVPVDLITSSSSGLDPHISPEAALFQVSRIANARKVPKEFVIKLINKNIAPRQFGFLGEPRVNVLTLNIELDKI